MSELSEYDWSGGANPPPFKREILYNIQARIYMPSETEKQRHLRMLTQVSKACYACTMCPLGKDGADNKGIIRDPHVFSSMTPSKFVVIGQNPGWNELGAGLPFVGQAGKNFDAELALHGVSRDQLYITNVVKCLRHNTRIQLADGTYRPIAHLVRERFSGLVKCVINGQITNRPVTGWYKSPIAGRQLYKLSFLSSARSGRKDVRGTVATGDHTVLTLGGSYKSIDSLTSADQVCTGTIAPGPQTEQIILGSMLGDASAPRGSGFTETHGMAQREYLLWKSTNLESFGFVISTGAAIAKDKVHPFIRMHVRGCAYFRKLRRTWYPKAKKIIPQYVLDTIDIRGLAIWYCDDGNLNRIKGKRPRVSFATCGFTTRDIDKLRSLLKKKFGFSSSRVWSNGWRINLLGDSTDRFLQLASPYIHPSLAYKSTLPVGGGWAIPDTGVFFDAPVIKPYDLRSGKEGKYADRSVYCIDVKEAHNFITLGGVLHNCYTTDNAKPTAQQIATCDPFIRIELSLLQPTLLITLGAVAFGQMCPSKNYQESLGQITDSEPYGFPVYAVYHPSPLNLADKTRKVEFAAQIKRLCGVIKAL